MADPLFPVAAIARHRMGSDGRGVCSLVAARGCPLRCRMCINAHLLSPDIRAQLHTPAQLYEQLRQDDLYFRATGGGVTFGGGEPLLHADFIRRFRELCGSAWRLTAESCLNIPPEPLETAMDCLDEFIVDIKDTDPGIYRRYTGADNAPVLRNLERLIARRGPDCVLVRVPRIPGYNTDADVRRSLDRLSAMGFSRFDVFTYTRPESGE